MPHHAVRNALPILVGTTLVAVGAYLRWLGTNPALPPDAEIPTVHYPGMGTGIESWDFVVLGATSLALFALAFRPRTRLQSAITFLSGGTAMFLCAFYLRTFSPLVGFDATFVPAVGWYLTVLGGILLTGTGGLRLRNRMRN
ncbi:hypothetical protein [Halopelagius fulvigenes]|uniref:DUF998 domain-containing protein n=1 Tax=Halopelagius fulvigenes TaxID=1198324 RepID=A0ABD5TYE3_9EURY